MPTAYRTAIVHARLHLAALLLIVADGIAWALHYLGTAPGNSLTWACWLLAIVCYTASFLPTRQPPRRVSRSQLAHWGRLLQWPQILQSGWTIALLVLGIYFVSHLWNFGVAPWNTAGLFDDAAWDIYFAHNHAFNGPYQPAFFDDVGIIARETLFHYYITAFFAVFGFNLLVFNVSLLVLGAVTVLFTALAVHRLFHQIAVTIAAALLLNFLPTHFVQVFVGHRYAIAAPLMMVSIYFLYSGFQDRSFARTTVSGLLAALCFGSAVMGKQLVLGLAAAAILLPLLDRRRRRFDKIRGLSLAWFVAFIIGATPLLAYIAFNWTDYFRRESGALSGFVSLWVSQGYAGVAPMIDQLVELFLAPDTWLRLWTHDFPIIPPAEWLLLIPGLVIAVARRRFEILFLAFIPVGSALLAGPYDFRVLLAAPIWVLAMAFTLNAASLGRLGPERWRPVGALLAVIVVAAGVIPSAAYLLRISGDPDAEYLLPHRDVAVSRLIQDVVSGAENPSPEMKTNEFNRPEASADLAYQQRGKGLRMIWEDSEISRDTIARFAELERYGSSQRYSGSVDGKEFSIWVLTIEPANLTEFQAAVARAAVAQAAGIPR